MSDRYRPELILYTWVIRWNLAKKKLWLIGSLNENNLNIPWKLIKNSDKAIGF